MKDVLSDILDTIDLKAALYFRTDFRPPFGVQVPHFERAARFHLIVQGECHVSLDDGSHVVLKPGDLVLVPNGSPHLLSSAACHVGMPLEDAFVAAGFTGQGPFVLGDGPAESGCQLVCGHFGFATGADHPLLHAVPDLLHITAAERATQPMLDDVVRLIVRRMFANEAGVAASVSRLSEVLFIEVMRAATAKAPELGRLITAVTDPHIGHALALIHNDVAAPWTVERLGSAVAMSRSRFAERFRDLVGSSPMSYVTEWRLQRGLYLLNRHKTPVKQVATQVGFQSAAAFTRAFTERFGHSPTRVARDDSAS